MYWRDFRKVTWLCLVRPTVKCGLDSRTDRLADSPSLIKFHCSLTHVAVLSFVWSSYSNVSIPRGNCCMTCGTQSKYMRICMAIMWRACGQCHTVRLHLSMITSCSTPLFLVPPARQMHRQSVTISFNNMHTHNLIHKLYNFNNVMLTYSDSESERREQFRIIRVVQSNMGQ